MNIQCHVFAGLGGPVTAKGTRALDRLMDNLSPEWDASHWYHGQWKTALAQILANGGSRIILIGHSYGALRCQRIAEELNKHGVDVAYIAGIDPTALTAAQDPMFIPSNVVKVDEFWSTRGLFNMPRINRWRYPDGKRGGMYRYGRGVIHKVHKIRAGHIGTASHKTTRKIILQSVKEAIG